MATQDAYSDRRRALGFTDAVTQYIAPLLAAKGFTRVEQSVHAVTFRSPTVALTVFHDSLSYEIEVVYALRVAPSECYDLRNLLSSVLGPGSAHQSYFQAGEYDRVVASIQVIAGLLQKHGEKILAGDPNEYQRIAGLTRIESAMYTKDVVQRPIREAAEGAWRKHDYAKVRALYGQIEGDLTEIEKRRLRYATSRCPGSDECG